MGLPRYVKVGPYRFDIEVTDLDPLRIDKENASWGVLRREIQKILIERSQGKDSMADSVLHEVLHAIVFVSGLQRREDEEEEVVSRLSPFLLQVIRENPKLIEYLRGGDEDV